MRKYLGDILLEKGYLGAQELERALDYQARKVLAGGSGTDWVSQILIEVARKRYNHREEFYLGRILTELKMLPEEQLREALDIQARSPDERPRGKLQALTEISQRINGAYNLIELLNLILVSAAELADAEAASLIVHDAASNRLVILMPTGPRAEAVRELEIPKGRGIAGWVYESGQPVVANDLTSDERFYPVIDMATGFHSRQIICVPLSVKGRRLGAIEVVNKKRRMGGGHGTDVPDEAGAEIPGRGFSRADLGLLEALSSQAAIAIENTRLSLALSEADRDLEQVRAWERTHSATLMAEALLGEMRRSLVPLEGWSKRLREELPDQKVEKYTTYLDAEMGRLSNRVEEMVHFLRDDWTPVRQRIPVRDLLRDLLHELWVDCTVASITPVFRTEGEPAVSGDRQLLLACLRHLFRNSRDAMRAGGEFSIRATERGSDVVLVISDQGAGIPAALAQHLFEPLRTEGKHGAAGLGLAMARRILELHGGTIRLVDAPGTKGAAFEITLPAAPPG